MRTIMIYDQLDADIKFIVLEGNYGHLHRVYINSVEAGSEEEQRELGDLLYDGDTGVLKYEVSDTFPALQSGDKVIVAGFLP